MANALFVSGGIKESGTLRTIQLKRQGKVVKTLDLYDLLLRGDTSGDARLQAGDVIFIPSVGKTVGVRGQILRPAIYELLKKDTVQQLVDMAGGFTPQAYPEATNLERVTGNGGLTVIDVDLSKPEGRQ